MVVEKQSGPAATKASTGRRMLVGTNVAVATLIVAAICVVAQLFAYDSSRWDMTSSGVNSLGEGTENLLRGLGQNVRLTSLYFETDREDEDQQRYRRAAQNLLDLYEATNRGKVTAEWVNPLKDHEKFQKLIARLHGIRPSYAPSHGFCKSAYYFILFHGAPGKSRKAMRE